VPVESVAEHLPLGFVLREILGIIIILIGTNSFPDI